MKCGEARWVRVNWTDSIRLLCVLDKPDPLGGGLVTKLHIGPDGLTVWVNEAPSYEIPMVCLRGWGWHDLPSQTVDAQAWDWFKGDWRG